MASNSLLARIIGFLGILAGMGLLYPLGSTASSDFLGTDTPIFKRQDLRLEGRLRHLTLEDVFPKVCGLEIVILEREGKYPKWKTRITVWDTCGKRQKLQARASIQLPADTLFYGFLPSSSEKEPAVLVLLRPSHVEVWKAQKGKWSLPSIKFRAPASSPFPVAQPGNVNPFPYLLPSGGLGGSADSFWLPHRDGIEAFLLTKTGLRSHTLYKAPVRAYYRTSVANQAFDLPFWVRGSLWYPQAHFGRLKQEGDPLLFFPWMDELTMLPLTKGATPRTHFFERLSEKERDDGTKLRRHRSSGS